MCRRKCIIERSRKPSRKTTCIYTTGHHSLNPLWQPTKFSSFPSDLTRTIILWLSLAPSLSLSLYMYIYIYIQYTLSCSSVFRTEPNGPRICCRLYSWTGGWLALFIPSRGGEQCPAGALLQWFNCQFPPEFHSGILFVRLWIGTSIYLHAKLATRSPTPSCSSTPFFFLCFVNVW